PYLCAFIVEGGNISINVNTASAEVLQSLSADMTDSLVENIIERRNEEPFTDLTEFTNFENLGEIIENTDKLSTSSEYFLLRTQAIIGQANKVMYSVIYRDENGETTIISRTQRTL
ncbi:MAG: general secretion pathway protein GspK, partial [Gammaproteobacteria bacterium]|nr:general secretion pathway protein GspK [Gammaproteobacteria bacterium]